MTTPAGPPLATIPLVWPSCVLASSFSGGRGSEPELQATDTAVKTLKAAGYEPEAVLDLLSKLSYDNPRWSNSIVADDLLDLRAKLDSHIPPLGGYQVDSSQFKQLHESLSTILRPNAGKPRNLPPSLKAK